MASLMENLIEVLMKECDSYEVLLKLSQRKTPVIVGANLEELTKITDEEQAVVSGIANLEKTRMEVTSDIANVLNKDVSTLTLTNLAAMLSTRPAEQEALATAHDRLASVVQRLKRVNEQNSELLADALEMVEFEMNLLQAAKTAPVTGNYNKGAYSAGDTMGTNRGGFDAKQ